MSARMLARVILDRDAGAHTRTRDEKINEAEPTRNFDRP